MPHQSASLTAQAARSLQMAATITTSVLNTATCRTIDWLDTAVIPATEAVWASAHRFVENSVEHYRIEKRIRLLKARAIRAAQITGPTGIILKRALDVTAAGTALLLLSPLFLVIGVLIRRSMGGPVIYAHPRVGQGGKIFNCYKFRSMVQNSAEVLERHLAENPVARIEWEATRKLRNDPRITQLGHFLRRSSIDELPQLMNVVRGEMSLVGPRPIVASELELYKPYTAEYIAMRPGITGLWQVSGRSNTTYARRVELDRFYARRWSLGLDVDILLRTIPALVRTNEAV